MKNSELGDKLLLLLEEVADHLLPVVDVLGHHLLGHDPGLGHAALLGLLGGDLLHIVAREPSCLAIQGSLPPTSILLLGDCDDISFLEL